MTMTFEPIDPALFSDCQDIDIAVALTKGRTNGYRLVARLLHAKGASEAKVQYRIVGPEVVVHDKLSDALVAFNALFEDNGND